MHLRLSGSSKLSVALSSNLEGDASNIGCPPRPTSASHVGFRNWCSAGLVTGMSADAVQLPKADGVDDRPPLSGPQGGRITPSHIAP